MLSKSSLVAVAVAALVGAAPAVASADTLGSVTPPPAVQATIPCPAGPGPGFLAFAQASSNTVPFVVPAEGEITQWQTNQTGNTAPAGEQIGLFVVHPSQGSYDVVGSDLENLPNTLPADGIVTFPIANPIKVSAGDLLGLWSPTVLGGPSCVYNSTDLPGDSVFGFGPVSGALTPGEALPLTAPNATSNLLLDLAATFVPNQDDASVSTAVGPANSIVGEPALLSSTVTNGNVDNVPITFTDAIPGGLTIDSAVAGSGACSTAGQVVSCTISGLAPGQSAPVQVVVTPSAAGNYQNSVSITVPQSAADPNPANNAASAPLTVAPAPSATVTSASLAHCVVPALNRIPAPFARRVLGLLGCKVGKSRQVHSKNVAKGEVIRSTPGAGTYAAGRRVAIQVSSGPAAKRK